MSKPSIRLQNAETDGQWAVIHVGIAKKILADSLNVLQFDHNCVEMVAYKDIGKCSSCMIKYLLRFYFRRNFASKCCDTCKSPDERGEANTGISSCVTCIMKPEGELTNVFSGNGWTLVKVGGYVPGNVLHHICVIPVTRSKCVVIFNIKM